MRDHSFWAMTRGMMSKGQARSMFSPPVRPEGHAHLGDGQVGGALAAGQFLAAQGL
jgi:hypothetical protein